MAEKETKSCSDCIHFDVCYKIEHFGRDLEDTSPCEQFISKDVAPVRHGRWIYNPNGMDFNLGAWECSVCTQKNNNLPCSRNISPYLCVGSKYCPNCGAKMFGGEGE